MSERIRYPSPLIEALKRKEKIAFVNEAKVINSGRGFISAPSINQLRNPERQRDVARIIVAEFEDEKIDKILGIPISGIPLASSVASELNGVKDAASRKGIEVPGSWKDPVFSVEARSFTSDIVSSIKYSFINPGDRVLVVDDIIAYGETADAVIESLHHQAQADIVGLAVWMSKDFQGGLERIERKYDIKTFAVIRIAEINSHQKIILKEEYEEPREVRIESRAVY